MFRTARQTLLPVAALGFVTGLAFARISDGNPIPAIAQPQVARPSAAEAPLTQRSSVATTGARYPAQVLRVIDGDTLEARVGIWLGQEITTKVRLRGIDAPELMGACPSESAQALAARDHLERLVAGGRITLQEIGPDKYHGRVVARVMTALGDDAGARLVAEGHARPWTGRREARWCAL